MPVLSRGRGWAGKEEGLLFPVIIDNSVAVPIILFFFRHCNRR